MPYKHEGPALYLTADREHVVSEGDPRAAFLLVAEGGTLPDEDVARYKLHDLVGAENKLLRPAAENKAAEPWKDPMSRVGVTFTEEQKEQIRQMVEAGKVAEAQQSVLDTLAEEFGWATDSGVAWNEDGSVVFKPDPAFEKAVDEATLAEEGDLDPDTTIIGAPPAPESPGKVLNDPLKTLEGPQPSSPRKRKGD